LFEIVNVDEIGNVNNNHSRLIEQAAVTFYRDCCGRSKQEIQLISLERNRKLN